MKCTNYVSNSSNNSSKSSSSGWLASSHTEQPQQEVLNFTSTFHIDKEKKYIYIYQLRVSTAGCDWRRSSKWLTRKTRAAQDASVKAAASALTERLNFTFGVGCWRCCCSQAEAAHIPRLDDRLAVLQWTQLVLLYNTDDVESNRFKGNYEKAKQKFYLHTHAHTYRAQTEDPKQAVPLNNRYKFAACKCVQSIGMSRAGEGQRRRKSVANLLI